MKPNLRELYEEKERLAAQKAGEIEIAGRAIRKLIEQFSKELMEHPTDIKAIAEAAKICREQFQLKMKELDFETLNKWDVERLWNWQIQMLRRGQK